MSFAEYFASAAPRGFALPEELHRALDFLESAGHGEAFHGEDGPEGFLSVSADPVSGSVFYIDFDLTGYLDTDRPGAERLVPVVDPDGGGSRIMAWAGTDGTAPYRYLFLGAEGEGPFLVAENTVDLLRLLAVGYAWIGEDTLGRTPAEAGGGEGAGRPAGRGPGRPPPPPRGAGRRDRPRGRRLAGGHARRRRRGPLPRRHRARAARGRRLRGGVSAAARRLTTPRAWCAGCAGAPWREPGHSDPRHEQVLG